MKGKQISYYTNLDSTGREAKLSSMLEAIKNGTFQKQIEQFKSLKENECGELKNQLPHFSPSGTFNDIRRAENLAEYNQIMILEIDNIGSKAEEIKNKAAEVEFTLAAFISHSGESVKIFVKTDSNPETHERYFDSVAKYYEKTLNVTVDQSGKDISGVCFISYDPTLYFNGDSTIFSTVNETPEIMFSTPNTTSSLEKTNIEDLKYDFKRSKSRELIEPSQPVYYTSLLNSIDYYDKMPEPKYIWNGIVEGSFGYIYGPSGGGKTITCENLGMCLAIGKDSFLGISVENSRKRKVLLIAMEEYGKLARKRNSKQIEYLNLRPTDEFPFDVSFENFPEDFSSEEDWHILESVIEQSKAEVVFIDSMTRATNGQIEDSSVGRRVSIRLRSIARKYNITLIVIHHSTKLNGDKINLDSLAGSRVIAQEADFVYAINMSDNVRYLKEIKSRYKPLSDTVIVFKINDNAWLDKVIDSNENYIVVSKDNREKPENDQMIIDAVKENTSEKSPSVKTTLIQESLTSIGKSEFYRRLKRLNSSGRLIWKNNQLCLP